MYIVLPVAKGEGIAIAMDTMIGDNELVCRKLHRYEPTVTAQPLTINDNQQVVLNKPYHPPCPLLKSFYFLSLPQSPHFQKYCQ